MLTNVGQWLTGGNKHVNNLCLNEERTLSQKFQMIRMIHKLIKLQAKATLSNYHNPVNLKFNSTKRIKSLWMKTLMMSKNLSEGNINQWLTTSKFFTLKSTLQTNSLAVKKTKIEEDHAYSENLYALSQVFNLFHAKPSKKSAKKASLAESSPDEDDDEEITSRL